VYFTALTAELDKYWARTLNNYMKIWPKSKANIWRLTYSVQYSYCSARSQNSEKPTTRWVMSLSLSVRPFFHLSIRQHRTTRLPKKRIFIKFLFELFTKPVGTFHYKLEKIKGTLHEHLRTFILVSLSVLKMWNNSNKSCKENQNKKFMLSNVFRKSCRLWDNEKKKNMVEPERPQITL
jgi:hypothetical protein